MAKSRYKIKDELRKELSEPNPTELYINTDDIRRMAQSVKDGQGTRVGSMAKMLIGCCDEIDRLTAELRAANEQITMAEIIVAESQNYCKICEHTLKRE